MIEFDVLYPPGAPASADDLLAAHPISGLAVNMVATIDGRIDIDGGATGLGGPGDKAMFGALRRTADGILAGTGTLRAERYRPLRRAALLIMTRSGEVPFDIPAFGSVDQRVLIAGPAVVPDGIQAQVEVFDGEDGDAIAGFRARGIETILCEGGPTLNGALLTAGVVDELFVTLDATLRAGHGPRLVEGGPPELRAGLRWVLRHGDELLLRYRIAN